MECCSATRRKVGLERNAESAAGRGNWRKEKGKCAATRNDVMTAATTSVA